MVHLLVVGEVSGYSGEINNFKFSGILKDVSFIQDINSVAVFLENQKTDLIIVNVELEVASLTKFLKLKFPDIPVYGYSTVIDRKNAVKAIKAGVLDYIFLEDKESLISVINSCKDNVFELRSYSDKMNLVIDMLNKISSSQANILLTGESGTGKEVAARYIHMKSSRRNKDWVAINCASIPENLLESELFGYEKGAFTGALTTKKGKFEQADKSTLFLDEISEMNVGLQAKLLRAIQEKEITRLGSSTPVSLDFRIIATSNRNLNKEVECGNFRQDLFFRLSVINIHLPPLRERKEDIVFLTEGFIKKYSEMNGLKEKPFTDSFIKKLKEYSWPGNIRELENVIHRVVLLSEGNKFTNSDIEDIGITDSLNNSAAEDFVCKTINRAEQELISKTLNYCSGNKTKTADILGISIRTLRNKLECYKEKLENA